MRGGREGLTSTGAGEDCRRSSRQPIRGLVRVRHRRGEQFAGPPVSLSDDTAHWFRLSQTHREAGARIAHGSTANRAASRPPMDRRRAGGAFDDWRCHVVALDVHRTFWEKATILHSEHHRPADKPTPDRFSRHYADTVALAQNRVASTAVGQGDLRDRVVAWKSRFFGSAWARYDLARPDTFRLVPPKEREAALRQDYAAMRDMYLSEPRTFDDILRALADLERRINSETS